MILPFVPDFSHAMMARFSGSVPCLAMTFSDMRTLAPIAMSAFSPIARAQASSVELGNRKRRQAGVGDMDERIEPGARLRHDMTAERREVVGAGIARRHAGGG